MPAVLVTAIIIAALAYILWASVEKALVAYLAVILLLPAALVLPNALVSVLTVPRLAILALALRVVIGMRRGEISVDVLRPTVVHTIFFVFVAVALINGVMLAAPLTSTAQAVNGWLGFVDQFLVFVVVLAMFRAVRDTRSLSRRFTIVIGVMAGIAILERITGTSWARLVLENMPGGRDLLAAIPLGERGGGLRVRVAAGFGLQFGWIAVMVFGVAGVTAIRSQKWTIRLVPFALALAIYWSNTRSAIPGVAVVIAIVALLGGSGRAMRIGLAGLAAGALLWFGVPSVRAPFQGARQTASTQIRSERLPEITDIVRGRPYQGLGIGGLDSLGFPTTDSSYLLLYAEFGVVGAAVFSALMLVLLAYCLAGLRGPPSWERLLAAAGFAGVVAGLMGAGAFDLFSLEGSANVFWVMAALAVVLAERDRRDAPRTGWPVWRRLVLAPTGLAAGLLLATLVPSHADVVTPFDSVPLPVVAAARGDIVYPGGFYRDTACGIAKAVRLPEGVNLECQDKFRTPGFGQLRVDAPSVAKARAGMATVTAALEKHLHGVRFHPSRSESGRPTWARTAPVWAGVGGLLVALFCRPATSLLKRRRGDSSGESTSVDWQTASLQRTDDGARQASRIRSGTGLVSAPDITRDR